MMIPEISVTVAAILIVMQMSMMLSVGMHRAVVKIGVGHGEDEDLHRKIRRHANLAENAALFLIALALAEISGASTFYLSIFAGLFIVARASHGLAFTSSSGSHAPQGSVVFPAMRIVGAFGTVGAGVGVSVLLINQVLSSA